MAKKKGVTLPDYLQEEAPTAVNSVQEGSMVSDLVGAMRLVGGVQEDEL